MQIEEAPNTKILKSNDYNYIFSKKTGFFIRWGKNKSDNPEYSPYGPEIMDIELSTICSKSCPWCYKTNSSKGKNMSLETFSKLLDIFPPTVTQIAFSIGDIDANPDLFKIMRLTRDRGIIPNITINGQKLTPEICSNLASVCGAVAVSHYNDEDCFNAVETLSKLGIKQINIHSLLSEDTYGNCNKLMESSRHNPKLEGLANIVFLLLKPKGERNFLNQIKDLDKYKKLIDFAFENGVRVGFDSCSASSFLKAVKKRSNYRELEMMAEPCESTLFSYYINVDGLGFPCSFTEEMYEAVDLLKTNDFVREVWYANPTSSFRNDVLRNKNEYGCRMCPAYELEMK